MKVHHDALPLLFLVVYKFSLYLQVVEEKVFAVHDVFSSIFFASIGLHVFPSFVIIELTLLISLTTFVVAGKLPNQSRCLVIPFIYLI